MNEQQVRQQELTRQQFIMLLINTPEEYIYERSDNNGLSWFYSDKFVEPFQVKQSNGMIRELKMSEIPLTGSYWIIQHENN